MKRSKRASDVRIIGPGPTLMQAHSKRFVSLLPLGLGRRERRARWPAPERAVGAICASRQTPPSNWSVAADRNLTHL